MRALVIGGTGDIGSAVVKELKKLKLEVLIASRTSGDIQVDINSTDSIKKMYKAAGPLDAVICSTGRGVPFKPISEMTKKDYEQGLQGKLMSQIDLVVTGIPYLNEKGSFTLTSGILNREFIPKGSCAALVNNAIDSFVESGSLELPKSLRLNVVSPNLLQESKGKYGDFFVGFDGIPAQIAALAYVRSVMGILNGKVIKV